MRGGLLAALAAVLLCAPTLASTTSSPFSASSVILTGATALEGPLTALHVHTTLVQPDESWILQLNASSIHAFAQGASSTSVNGIGFQPAPPNKTEASYGESAWQMQAWMPGASLFVEPVEAADLMLDALSSTLLPANLDCVSAPPHFNGQDPENCVKVAGALTFNTLDSKVTLRLRGHLKLTLWGWNTTAGPEGEWSGSVSEPVGSPALAGRLEALDKRILKLDATDASAEITVPASALAGLFLSNASVRSAGIMVLEATNGNNTQVAGPLTAYLEARDGFVLASIQAADEPKPVAQPVTSVVQSPANNAESPWWWIAPLALALLAMAAYALRRRSTRERLVVAALDSGRHGEAADRVRNWAGSPTPQTAVLKAIALLKDDRIAEAERFLWSRDAGVIDEAARMFLMATVRATQGRDGDAVSLLARCFALEKGYRSEAAMNSQLRRVLNDMGPASGTEAYS